MITGMERLKAAMRGEPSDRIPVFCNLLDQGARELGLTPEEYFSKGRYVAEAQLRLRDKYGYDNLWCFFYVGREAEVLGCNRILFASDGSPNVADFVIKSDQDIHRLTVPEDITGHPAFAESLTCLDLLRKAAGGKYPICVYVTSSMTLPTMLMGMDRWMELLLMGPNELRDELLAKCSVFFRREVVAYRAAGADILLYSNPFGSTDIVPMKLVNDLSLPWMKRDLDGLGVEDMVFYCGTARLNRVIGPVIDQLGFTSFNLSPMDEIAEARRIIGSCGLICASINDIKLLSWTREEIRSEVRRLMGEGMPGGKFVFGTMSMPLGVPEEKIRTMLEAAYEFGSYQTKE